MSNDLENGLKELLGGDEGVKDIFAEAVKDKLDDDGMLVYVPPITPLRGLEDRDVDAIAEMDAVNMFRYIYSDLRDGVREMIDEVFTAMKSSENEPEVRLNPEFNPEVGDNEIDFIVKSMLDGGDNE